MRSSVITRHLIPLVRMHPLSGLRMNKACMRDRCWYGGSWSEGKTTVLSSLEFGVGVLHDFSLGKGNDSKGA